MNGSRDLADLFPAGPPRHHLTLGRGEPGEFFRPQDLSGELLRERQRWLEMAPKTYAQLSECGRPLLAEFCDLSASWTGPQGRSTGWGSEIVAVGAAFEPDLLFLSPDEQGDFRLRGGALCFPTGWALTEKIGQTLNEIHAIVPGLNAALAPGITRFLRGVRPGSAYLRDNWGIAASSELNLHPVREIPPPTLPIDLKKLWLRVEHQALCALPESRGVVFGIRISVHRLDRVNGTPAGNGLRNALVSMPAELATYKRIADIRLRLAEALG